MQKKQARSIPILLSAFGFPGLGQFAQKRWPAGIAFSVLFLVGFFWIMVLAFHNIIELYSMAFSDDWSVEPDPHPLTAFIRPLILVGVVYFISLFDTFRTQLEGVPFKKEPCTRGRSEGMFRT